VSTSRLLATDLDAQTVSLTLQIFHVNLLFTEEDFSSHADNSLRTKVYELVLNWPTCTLLVLSVLYSYFTGAALPSVSSINSGIRHTENAAPCTVARDVSEVTWSLPTVARPSSYRVTQQHADRREVKGGEARRGSAPLLLRSRFP
jgi:hypothetical protein